MLNEMSIRFKLFLYMAISTLIMLIMLLLYQTIFSERFFIISKWNAFNPALSDIENHLYSEDLQSQIDTLSDEQNSCILITDSTMNTLYSTKKALNPDCLLGSVSQSALKSLKNRAQANKGSLFEILNLDDLSVSSVEMIINSNLYSILNFLTLSPTSPYRLISVKIYDNVSIFMDTSASPPKIAQDIIMTSIIYAALIFLLLTFFLVRLLSGGITRPIKQLSDTVRHFSLGDYSVHFKAGGCMEIRQLSDALNYMVGELRQLEKKRQDLISDISHDIRTPLTSIIAYGELIRDYPEEYSAESFQLILKEANWLSELVNNLLQIARLRDNAESLVISAYDLTEEIEQILMGFRKLRQKDGYIINFDYREHVVVEADRLRISRVVYNFVSNAIKHTGKDKTITIKQTVADKHVCIEIHNSGDYIEKDEIPYIWNRYYRSKPSRGRNAERSVGIGLSIKSILDSHNAQYGVESNPETGCTFWFRLQK